MRGTVCSDALETPEAQQHDALGKPEGLVLLARRTAGKAENTVEAEKRPSGSLRNGFQRPSRATVAACGMRSFGGDFGPASDGMRGSTGEHLNEKPGMCHGKWMSLGEHGNLVPCTGRHLCL